MEWGGVALFLFSFDEGGDTRHSENAHRLWSRHCNQQPLGRQTFNSQRYPSGRSMTNLSRWNFSRGCGIRPSGFVREASSHLCGPRPPCFQAAHTKIICEIPAAQISVSVREVGAAGCVRRRGRKDRRRFKILLPTDLWPIGLVRRGRCTRSP